MTAEALQSLYVEAARLVAPESLADSLASAPTRPIKCAFSLANRVRNHFSQFSAEQKKVLAKLVDRPALPYYSISPTGLFRIHYTLTGSDAVDATDLDGNAVPDYVDEAAESLEKAYAVIVDTLGFNPPPADDGLHP